MRKGFFGVAVALLAGPLALSAPAALLYPTVDGFARSDNTTNLTDGTVLVGGTGTERRDFFIFSLAGVTPLQSATFRLVYHGDFNSVPGNVILTTIADTDNPGTIDSGDFAETALTVAGSPGELFLAKTATPTAGNVIALDVTTRINADLAAGRAYSTIRLNMDVYQANTGRYFRTQNYSATTIDASDPVLETTVPEPASLGVLGTMGLLLARRRKH